jgi:hypothetical protein
MMNEEVRLTKRKQIGKVTHSSFMHISINNIFVNMNVSKLGSLKFVFVLSQKKLVEYFNFSPLQSLSFRIIFYVSLGLRSCQK